MPFHTLHATCTCDYCGSHLRLQIDQSDFCWGDDAYAIVYNLTLSSDFHGRFKDDTCVIYACNTCCQTALASTRAGQSVFDWLERHYEPPAVFP